MRNLRKMFMNPLKKDATKVMVCAKVVFHLQDGTQIEEVEPMVTTMEWNGLPIYTVASQATARFVKDELGNNKR